MNKDTFYIPTESVLLALRDRLAPGSQPATLRRLDGSFSNHSYLAEYEAADGLLVSIVIRLYTGGDAGKARREYHALKLLQDDSVPVPEPLLLDETGDLLGSAGIVTRFVPGSLYLAETHGAAWQREIATVARTLAAIHATPYPETAQDFLMDGNYEIVWFLHGGKVPDYMLAHPDGESVWQAVRDYLPHIETVPPVLLHLDYWSGNVLWHENRISAVVDWEEAAFGDPAVDLGYCRMELYLEGMDEAADELLRVYELAAGRKVANLGLWELAAAARPMTDPEAWFTRSGMQERFRRFIAAAMQRADTGS